MHRLEARCKVADEEIESLRRITENYKSDVSTVHNPLIILQWKMKTKNNLIKMFSQEDIPDELLHTKIFNSAKLRDVYRILHKKYLAVQN